MKFGYVIFPTMIFTEIKDLALKAEELGFDSIHVPDHLNNQEKNTRPWLEGVSTVSALAAVTEKIKLGFIVLCNSYRNPAYLAKVISTIDNISNGRALMWLGAGWNKQEYKQYGYPFPTPKERVDQVEESLTIYKKMFTEHRPTFEGKFWKLKRTINYPKPIQKPYPQIVLGTTGLRMTDIACRETDGINISFAFPIKDLPERLSLINEKLKKYDRDPSEFEISLFYHVTLVKRQEELERYTEMDLNHAFIGFPEDIKEKFAELEDLGVNKMTIRIWDNNNDQLQVFSEKVM